MILYGFDYARNLLSQVPKSAQPWVATLLRTVFEQPGLACRVQGLLARLSLD